ncbi:MAG TPA: STELLO glycosyltransferase family protein [Pyrinomonadaceae bacterium]|nr:STELLO glycosyltransferase family protein [Pyrinomonadaceae bacterium]
MSSSANKLHERFGKEMTDHSEQKTAIVVTSIAGPNATLQALAHGSGQRGYTFIVIGDEPSPRDFSLDGCDFFGLKQQRELGLKFAVLCPTRHYARKNVGYLLAMRAGATVIIETDDDNAPYETFWNQRTRAQTVRTATEPGWLNVYRYFTDANIWPRGFPLNRINAPQAAFDELVTHSVDAPIQQGLSDVDPDVDAIYRLTQPAPVSFSRDRRVALKQNVWCPFNSQNTTWWADAFPLLYLPAYCTFRMTDIWRSFIAQRIAWENNWSLLFHEPNTEQARNQHDLMRDFADEIPGYLRNSEICEALSRLQLRAGIEHLSDNLKICYEELVRMSVVDARELELLDAWTDDLKANFPKTYERATTSSK